MSYYQRHIFFCLNQRDKGEDACAQHDAQSKTYRYLVDTSAGGDPWRARYAHRWPVALDEAAVDLALALLPGTRDWSGFTASACTVSDRVRTMTEARRARIRPSRPVRYWLSPGAVRRSAR